MEICKNSILNLIKIPKFCGITGVKDNCVTGLPGLQKLCCHREKGPLNLYNINIFY